MNAMPKHTDDTTRFLNVDLDIWLFRNGCDSDDFLWPRLKVGGAGYRAHLRK
jgi:hypothetical protein